MTCARIRGKVELRPLVFIETHGRKPARMTERMDRESMELVKHPGKWAYAALWGGLWAPLTVLGITLFDWYRTRQLESLRHIALKLVIFVTLGILYGLGLHRYHESRVAKNPTRARQVTQIVLFVVLMMGLIYVLWVMASAR